MLLIFLTICFSIALIGFTYSVILTDDGMILDFWYTFLQSKFEDKKPKIFNVLIGCPKCVSGQAALWLYFFTPYFEASFLSIGMHLLFITITIWFSLLLNKIYTWIIN